MRTNILEDHMKSKTNTNKKSFTSWLHKNRLKVVILSFAIVIPITLIVLAYVGTYANSRKLYMDTEKPETLINSKEIIKIDDVTELNLNIELTEIVLPKLNEDKELSGGTYRFNVSYTPTVSSQFESVSATFILQTPWLKYRSSNVTRTLSTNDSSFLVQFNYVLPKRTLIFINVERPDLYIKLDIKRANTDFTTTYYIRHSLLDETPLVIE